MLWKTKTLEIMRAEKAEMYQLLRKKKGTKQYEWWFLRYIPEEIKRKQRRRKKIKQKKLKKLKKLKKTRQKRNNF